MASHELQQLRAELRTKDRKLRAALIRSEPPPCKASNSWRRSPRSAKEKQFGAGRPPTSQAVCAQGAQLSSQSHTEYDRLREVIACQEDDLRRAASEIEVLACALEARAESLGVDGNLHSGLLYQMGMTQKQSLRLEREIFKRDRAGRALERELQVSRSKISRLEQALEVAQSENAQLLAEREVILEYIRASSSKSNNLQEQVSELLTEKEAALSKYREAIRSEEKLRASLEERERLRFEAKVNDVRFSGREERDEEAGACLVHHNDVEHNSNTPLLEQTQLRLDGGDHLSRSLSLERDVERMTTELIDAKKQLETKDQELAGALGRIDALQETVEDMEIYLACSASHIDPLAEVQAQGSQKLVAEVRQAQSKLKGANRARAFAEAEAVRLEAENAKLRRALRSSSASSESTLDPEIDQD
mmetsp:Transcript_20254/g.64699  ORF Transcript_20254/g.64699 Transcript_20254/m.64699 type:complete len:420 (-) Transcript_20254:139-1398(-)